jgi:pyruvate/2-oxoglutarate dehydrogenase complex dihydrolipoamide dehydrogenase (E3) component
VRPEGGVCTNPGTIPSKTVREPVLYLTLMTTGGTVEVLVDTIFNCSTR